MKFDLIGAKELLERLKQMPDRMAVNVMRGATAFGANVLRDAIIVKTPVQAELFTAAGGHGNHEPGTLRKAIIARRLRTRGRDTVRSAVLIRPAGFYWVYLENGTSRMPPHPFIRPAVDTSAARASQTVVDTALKRIPEEFKK